MVCLARSGGQTGRHSYDLKEGTAGPGVVSSNFARSLELCSTNRYSIGLVSYHVTTRLKSVGVLADFILRLQKLIVSSN